LHPMRANLHLLPLFLALILLPLSLLGEVTAKEKKREVTATFKRVPLVYQDQPHSKKEILTHLSVVYGLSIILYGATQWDHVREDGSFTLYRKNFGSLTFDQDEPFWNWLVHPLSGSQLFLFYRAHHYSRPHALGMAFISSALFEFTIETYTEPASIQDLYQTPILGSMLGAGIEVLSTKLINSDNYIARLLGHVINPFALLRYYHDPPITISPFWGRKGRKGIVMMGSF
jgi:hypothetical protein